MSTPDLTSFPPAPAAALQQAPLPQVNEDPQVQRFLHLLQQGATLGALQGMEQTDCDALYHIGHGAYQQHNFKDAAQLFGFLTLHRHLERRYWFAYASALHMNGSIGDAIRAYTVCSLLDPMDLMPCLHTCECLLALGCQAEATEGLRMLVQQCRDDSQQPVRLRAQALLDLITDRPGSDADVMGEAA